MSDSQHRPPSRDDIERWARRERKAGRNNNAAMFDCMLRCFDDADRLRGDPPILKSTLPERTGEQNLYCTGCGKDHGGNIHAALAARCCPDKDLVTPSEYIAYMEKFRTDAHGVLVGAMQLADSFRDENARPSDRRNLQRLLFDQVDDYRERRNPR